MPSRLEAVLRAGEARRRSVPTGANTAPDITDEQIRQVLDWVVRGDPKEACRMAVRWCTLNRNHYKVCREAGVGLWTALTRRIFGDNAPTTDASDDRAQKNFYALCARAAAYRRNAFQGWAAPWHANSKAFVLAAIEAFPGGDNNAYHRSSDAMKRDPDVLLAAIQRNVRWTTLDLPEGLNGNRDFMLKALERANVFSNASRNLQQDQDFRNEALRRQAEVIRDWPTISSFGAMRDAVALNGLALRFVDWTFRNSAPVVTAAVQQNGLALEYATPKIKRNRKVVLRAIQQNPQALFYMDETLRTHDFILEAVQANPQVLAVLDEPLPSSMATRYRYSSELYAFNKPIEGAVAQFVPKQGEGHNPKRLTAEFVQEVNQLDPMLLLRGLPNRYKNSKNFVIRMVRRNPQALQYASPRLQQDPEVLEAVRQHDDMRNAMRVRLPRLREDADNADDDASDDAGVDG